MTKDAEERAHGAWFRKEAWWVVSAAWVVLYIVVAWADWHTITKAIEAGEWLDLLDRFALGAIGLVSFVALALAEGARQEAARND